LPIAAKILCGVDSHNTGAPERSACVDTRDARVRNLAAQECRVKRPGQRDIIDEQRLSGQQPVILNPSNRFTEIAGCHVCNCDCSPHPQDRQQPHFYLRRGTPVPVRAVPLTRP